MPITFGKHLLFLMISMGSIQAYAGQSTVLSKTEVIEVTNPTKAFDCHLGDGGFIFTTVSLRAHSIPAEFGSNFREAPGISVYFPNQNGNAFSCKEALRTVDEEINKQGGQLKVPATRGMSRFAYYDGGCKLFLAESIQVTVGTLHLSGVNTYFITELPIASPFECRDLIPDKI